MKTRLNLFEVRGLRVTSQSFERVATGHTLAAHGLLAEAVRLVFLPLFALALHRTVGHRATPRTQELRVGPAKAATMTSLGSLKRKEEK